MSFPSGDLTLRGWLYRPEGAGPFPAVVWNHGSERHPGLRPELGRFHASAGYVLLVPHRRGHGWSPGEYPIEALRARARAQTDDVAAYRRKAVELVIELHDVCLVDTLAAVRWLGRQSFVDSTRMAMSGVSHGAIQTVLAAESGAAVKAYVPFAPGAMAWRGNPELRDRLTRAVRAATAPMFLLQAENDYSLGPSEVLGDVLTRKGGQHLVRVYPPYGQSQEAGHGAFACHGMHAWGTDVRGFLDRALESSPATA